MKEGERRWVVATGASDGLCVSSLFFLVSSRRHRVLKQLHPAGQASAARLDEVRLPFAVSGPPCALRCHAAPRQSRTESSRREHHASTCLLCVPTAPIRHQRPVAARYRCAPVFSLCSIASAESHALAPHVGPALLVATGGDDNALCVSSLALSFSLETASSEVALLAQVVGQASLPDAHASTIQGACHSLSFHRPRSDNRLSSIRSSEQDSTSSHRLSSPRPRSSSASTSTLCRRQSAPRTKPLRPSPSSRCATRQRSTSRTAAPRLSCPCRTRGGPSSSRASGRRR